MFKENGQAASGDSEEGADAMDVEMSLPEPSLLGSLQKNTLQHEAKHQICRTNGNISGHVQKKTGAPINIVTIFTFTFTFPTVPIFKHDSSLSYDSFDDSFTYLSRNRNVMTPSTFDSLLYCDSPRTVYKPIYYFCKR